MLRHPGKGNMTGKAEKYLIQELKKLDKMIAEGLRDLENKVHKAIVALEKGVHDAESGTGVWGTRR